LQTLLQLNQLKHVVALLQSPQKLLWAALAGLERHSTHENGTAAVQAPEQLPVRLRTYHSTLSTPRSLQLAAMRHQSAATSQCDICEKGCEVRCFELGAAKVAVSWMTKGQVDTAWAWVGLADPPDPDHLRSLAHKHKGCGSQSKHRKNVPAASHVYQQPQLCQRSHTSRVSSATLDNLSASQPEQARIGITASPARDGVPAVNDSYN
jgi:hypothetical protein